MPAKPSLAKIAVRAANTADRSAQTNQSWVTPIATPPHCLPGLHDLIGGHIYVERVARPGLIHDLHLAEPLPLLILDLDVFHQARLGRHRRLETRDHLVSGESRGCFVRTCRSHQSPGDE